MRKYIKSMREQIDHQGHIFQQAKRKFHYQPNQNTRNFLKSKPKPAPVECTQQQKFKGDYSSVKQGKNENVQASESSWICKLINGIQEHICEQNKIVQSLRQKNVKEINSELQIELDPNQISVSPLNNRNKQNRHVAPQVTRRLSGQRKNILSNASAVVLKQRKNSQIVVQCSKSPSKIQSSKKHSMIGPKSQAKNQQRASSMSTKTNNFSGKNSNCSGKQKKKAGPKILPRKLFVSDSSTTNLQSQNDKTAASGNIRQQKNTIKSGELSQSLAEMQQIKYKSNIYDKDISFDEVSSKINILDLTLDAPLFLEQQNKQEKNVVLSKKQAGSIRKNSTNYSGYSFKINEIRQERQLLTQKSHDNLLESQKKERKREGLQQIPTLRDINGRFNYLSNRQESSSKPTIAIKDILANRQALGKENIQIKSTPKNSIQPVQKEQSNPKPKSATCSLPINLNKQAYLNESSNIFVDSVQQSNFRTPEYGTLRDVLKEVQPKKYSYLQSDQLDSNCISLEKDRIARSGQSDVLIDRLNNKLNSYIRRHQLGEHQIQTQQWKQGEPTYRLIHLDFNELKKHSDFYNS